MKNKQFYNYMPYNVEYPDPTQIDIFHENWLMSYISSSFLNGWINYINPIAAFAINRYSDANEFQEKIKQWETQEFFHTDLNFFRDDVVILGKTNTQNFENYKYAEIRKAYWFFWFDQDVSDCRIGRFHTIDAEQQVVESLKQHLTEWVADGSAHSIYEIDIKKLSGWMKF